MQYWWGGWSALRQGKLAVGYEWLLAATKILPVMLSVKDTLGINNGMDLSHSSTPFVLVYVIRGRSLPHKLNLEMFYIRYAQCLH